MPERDARLENGCANSCSCGIASQDIRRWRSHSICEAAAKACTRIHAIRMRNISRCCSVWDLLMIRLENGDVFYQSISRDRQRRLFQNKSASPCKNIATIPELPSAAYAALKHSERRTSRGGFAHPLEEQMLGPQFVEAASDQVRTVETQARSCTTRAPARPSATRPPTTPRSCQSRSKRSKKTRPSLPGLSRCVITRLTARSDWLWTGRAAA